MNTALHKVLLLVWYDHVIKECCTENMNITRVSPPLAYNNTLFQLYSDMYIYGLYIAHGSVMQGMKVGIMIGTLFLV